MVRKMKTITLENQTPGCYYSKSFIINILYI